MSIPSRETGVSMRSEEIVSLYRKLPEAQTLERYAKSKMRLHTVVYNMPHQKEGDPFLECVLVLVGVVPQCVLRCDERSASCEQQLLESGARRADD